MQKMRTKKTKQNSDNAVQADGGLPTRQFYHVANGSEDGRKILFVMATRRKVEEADSLPFFRVGFNRVVYPAGVTIDLVVHFENSDGLPKVYNSELDTCGNDYDLVVFIHDDCLPNDCLLVDKLLSASSSYDLIGLAGGKSWSPAVEDPRKEPVIWTNAARDGGKSGFVVHALPREMLRQTKSTEYDGRVLFATQYGDAPSPTLTLDGVLLCMTSKAIAAGLRFDESFDFHFYDMDLCFSAYSLGLKAGTCAAICTHASVGVVSDNDAFLRAQSKFLEKWFEG